MKIPDNRKIIIGFAFFIIALLSCNSYKAVIPLPKTMDSTQAGSGATATPTLGATSSPTPGSTPTFTPSATPTRTETPAPIGVYQMEIPANIVWYNTKIPMLTGQFMEITAGGKSNISGLPNHDDWGPDGDQGNCPLDCLLPGAGYGTLIGKITGGLPFKVGSRLTMPIPADGFLLLAINDNEPYYFDNSGFYSVTVRIWKNFGNT
jgi:hypothetical protein